RNSHRPTSGNYHSRKYWTLQETAEADRFFLRLGTRSQHCGSGFLSLDSMDFSKDLSFLVQPEDREGRTDFDLSRERSRQGAVGLCCRGTSELVPRAWNCARQRGSNRWQERGWRFPGR